VDVDVGVECGGQRGRGKISSLSLGGCYLTCPLKLRRGDLLDLAFFGTDMEVMIHVSGEVRHSTGEGHGIKFRDPSFEAREEIANLIYHAHLNESKQPLSFHPQRKEPRVALRLPVTLRGRDIFDKSFEEQTHTENVSRRGACVVTRWHLEVGSVVEVEAYGQFKAQAAVRVRWATRHRKEHFVVGVQFLEVEGDWIVR